VRRAPVFDGAHSVCRRVHGRPTVDRSTLRIMNLKRWWCTITTHKWRLELVDGADRLTCRRCGFVTNLEDESRQARHWDSSGYAM